MKLVGGRLCLDFVNTVGGRVSSEHSARDYSDQVVDDKIASFGDLAAWSELASITNRREKQALVRLAESNPGKAAATLKRAVTFRESLYRIFKCAVEKWRPDPKDLATLSQELSIARNHEQLTCGSRAFKWTWTESPGALDRILWPVARSAAELLTSRDLDRLRQCAGDRCGWMFLDTSRNRSRQWCDMNDCGNRAKVRRYRERQKPLKS